MSRIWLRWAPAAVAVVVVAGVAVAVPAVANASVSLPDKTPAQVLRLVASSSVRAFSGTVEETSDLGLPSLPAGSVPAGSKSSQAADLSLLTGPNSLRVFVDGSSRVRVQNLQSLAERDLVRNGQDVWVYDSKENSVLHAVIGDRRPLARPGALQQGVLPNGSAPDPAALTPNGLATRLLAELRKSSTLSVDSSVRVAGRPAYDLVLTPKATDTLIGAIAIAVDAQTGLPLRVDIDARGQKTPAVRIGFTSLDLTAPNASLFRFTPPADAKVTQAARPKGTQSGGDSVKAPAHTVTGSGWDSVVDIAAGGSLSQLSKSPEFAQLTTAVPGGRVLHTSLFNVLFTPDGRVLAGSVSVSRLQAVAITK